MDGGRVRRGSRRILVTVVACNVVLAVAILSVRSLGGVDPPDEPTRAAAPQQTYEPSSKPTSRPDDVAPPSWGVEVYNEAGRYVFSRPIGWPVTERDTVSEVSRPDGEVTVSFGVGPRGGIDRAFEQLNSLLKGGYDGIEIRIKDIESVDGAVIVTLAGTATTPGGSDIWLRGRLVDLPRDEPALAALGAGILSAENRGRRSANRILTSFRVLDPGS